MHLTGRYPDWWQGRTYPGPTKWWAAGNNNETTRDNPQRILMGEGEEWGTGSIPASCILDVKRARGVAGLLDQVKVQHVTGGTSQLQFKSYEQEREKWQGESLHGVWYDEEPPLEIYTEGLTRTNARKGIALLTATPLLGMTRVVNHFYPHPDTPDRALIQMTIEDAGFYTEDEIKKIVASYPEYERQARLKGIPMLGSGRIFPIADERITVDSFEIPEHWPQIGGVDFGWDHPTAAVKLAWDKDADVLYVTHEYKQSERTPQFHSSTLKRWGKWLPWAWPHDGLQHDNSGAQTANLYRGEGMRMLREKATYEDGGYGREAGIMEMLDRMRQGRLKVFAHLTDWFNEFHVYHRKDGKVVAMNDDLMSATRYAIMMKRFARKKTASSHQGFTAHGTNYDPFSHAHRRMQ